MSDPEETTPTQEETVETIYVTPTEESDLQKQSTELIPDEEWAVWVENLMKFLDKYDKKFKTMEFLLEIKKKGDDCSRAYTGMWALDMLHQAAKTNRQELGVEFELDVVEMLQKPWNVIMEKVRVPRQELLGTKCIEYFFKEYKNHASVISLKKLQKRGKTDAERWLFLAKHCHQLGLTKNKEYQDFLGKLMIEMVKY